MSMLMREKGDGGAKSNDGEVAGNVSLRAELEALKTSYRAEVEAAAQDTNRQTEPQEEPPNATMEAASLPTREAVHDEPAVPARVSEISEAAGTVTAATGAGDELSLSLQADKELVPFDSLRPGDERRVRINRTFQAAAAAWQDHSNARTARELIAELQEFADEAGIAPPEGVHVLLLRIDAGQKLPEADTKKEGSRLSSQSAGSLERLVRSYAPELPADQVQQAAVKLLEDLNSRTQASDLERGIADEKNRRLESHSKAARLIDELRKALTNDPTVIQAQAYLRHLFQARTEDYHYTQPCLSVITVALNPIRSGGPHYATLFLGTEGWRLETHNGYYHRAGIFDLRRVRSASISTAPPKTSILSQLSGLFFRSGMAPDDPVSTAFKSEAYAFKRMAEADTFTWPAIKSAIVQYLDAQLKAGLQNPIIHRRD